MQTCFLHIGSEKTGTTSIQRYCAQNRDSLLADGFWYPNAGAWEGANVHKRLSDAALVGDIPEESDLSIEFRDEYKAAAASGATRAIISSEFFHSRFRNEAAISRLKVFLARWFRTVRVVYYARRQDRLAASMHSTGIRGGHSTERSALSVFEKKRQYYFDHLAVCDLWAHVFGSENLICRIYERAKLENGDVIDDFESVVGLKHNSGRVREHANESLSLICMSVLLRLNASRHRKNDSLRRKLVATDRERPSIKIPLLTRTQAREFLSQFEDNNRKFFSRYVDSTLATEFEPGFADFPDDVPEPSHKEMLDFIFAPAARDLRD